MIMRYVRWRSVLTATTSPLVEQTRTSKFGAGGAHKVQLYSVTTVLCSTVGGREILAGLKC